LSGSLGPILINHTPTGELPGRVNGLLASAAKCSQDMRIEIATLIGKVGWMIANLDYIQGDYN